MNKCVFDSCKKVVNVFIFDDEGKVIYSKWLSIVKKVLPTLQARELYADEFYAYCDNWGLCPSDKIYERMC